MNLASLVYGVGAPLAVISVFQYFLPETFYFITSKFDWLFDHIQWAIGINWEWPLWYKFSIFAYAHIMFVGLFCFSGVFGITAASAGKVSILWLTTLPWLLALFMALFVQF